MKPDSTGCVGNTIITASGQYFDYECPRIAQVDIEDIATALAHTCRFGGHCGEFYSVAEHCCHCAKVAKDQNESDIRLQFHALLHDAAEAYVGDVPKPLKMLLPDYQRVEQSITEVVNDALGLTDDLACWPTLAGEVKRIDHCMLKAEKIHFFPDDPVEWAGFNNLPNVDVEIGSWEPRRARLQFLQWFNALDWLLAKQLEAGQ